MKHAGGTRGKTTTSATNRECYPTTKADLRMKCVPDLLRRWANGDDEMTIPAMMNCQHSADGWCLDCVKDLDAQLAAAQERVRVLEAALRHTQGWIEALPFASNEALAKGVTCTLKRIDAALAGTEPAKG